MEKVSIIIPAYNEERRIERTILEYSRYFNALFNENKIDYNIIIVINNTSDRTEEIVNNLSLQNKKINYINLKRGGKGHAVIEGFKLALRGDSSLIGFVDADLATSPEQYFRLIHSLNNYDGVIADRYLKSSEVFPKATFRRIVVSRIFNALIRSLFLMPYRDTQCGAKVFTKEAIEKVIPHLSMSKWAFDVELIYKLRKLGFSILPASTKWYDKEYSKINFLRAGPWMALALIRLRILNSPLRKSIRIYDKLIGFIPR